jgi:hypothetical protein
MLANTIKKVTWMARATTTIVGLAIALALVLGVATTALAGTGAGATFNLGQTNTVNAVSKLVGSVVGPSLTIDNNSTGATATALDLQVEPGKAPMKVNSDAQVANLNADELDGTTSAGFVQSAQPMKVVAAGVVTSDGRVITPNSNVVQVTKKATGFYEIQIAGVSNINFTTHIALATALGSDGSGAETSVTGSSPNSRVTVATTDANGTRVDNLFSFVVYDPTP